MRATCKKCLGLIFLGGLLLIALFRGWGSLTSSGVDIRLTQESPMKKLLDESINKTISGYADIAYHVKEDVAWWVVNHEI